MEINAIQLTNNKNNSPTFKATVKVVDADGVLNDMEYQKQHYDFFVDKDGDSLSKIKEDLHARIDQDGEYTLEFNKCSNPREAHLKTVKFSYHNTAAPLDNDVQYKIINGHTLTKLFRKFIDHTETFLFLIQSDKNQEAALKKTMLEAKSLIK